MSFRIATREFPDRADAAGNGFEMSFRTSRLIFSFFPNLPGSTAFGQVSSSMRLPGARRGHDVSSRGDASGFVRVFDPDRLAIPDRPGNNRLDTFENLLVNPAIGLLFVIPGIDELLRVNGTARLTCSRELLETMSDNGKPARLAIVVTVTEAFLHCTKGSSGVVSGRTTIGGPLPNFRR